MRIAGKSAALQLSEARKQAKLKERQRPYLPNVIPKVPVSIQPVPVPVQTREQVDSLLLKDQVHHLTKLGKQS
jgi:hypothetical protein